MDFASNLYVSDLLAQAASQFLDVDTALLESIPNSNCTSGVVTPLDLSDTEDTDYFNLPLNGYYQEASLITSGVTSENDKLSAWNPEKKRPGRKKVQHTPESLAMKRERRLERNRMSAQLSRQRKREIITSMDDQLSTLQNEKAALETLVSQLLADNETLRQQLAVATQPRSS